MANGVQISSYFPVIRAILGDRDPDIHIYDDGAIKDAVVAMVNLGEVPGFSISEDGDSVEPKSVGTPMGYVAADYGVNYGYAYNFAYAYQYNSWYDQGFIHLQQTLEQALAQDPPQGDCTPTGNPEAYARLIYSTANLFAISLSDFSFKTRAVAEKIDAPKELVFWIQQKWYDIKNGRKGSRRPPPLPVIAYGVRSLWNPGYGYSYGYWGYDLMGF